MKNSILLLIPFLLIGLPILANSQWKTFDDNSRDNGGTGIVADGQVNIVVAPSHGHAGGSMYEPWMTLTKELDFDGRECLVIRYGVVTARVPLTMIKNLEPRYTNDL